MRILCSVFALLFISGAAAQELPDILNIVEQQRNQALANHAISQAVSIGLRKEIEALKSAILERDKKIVDLEKNAEQSSESK